MKVGWKDINIVNYRKVSFCYVKVWYVYVYGLVGLLIFCWEL